MKIALLGDVALFGCNNVYNLGWEERFSGIRSLLDSCDYVVGNLETPLTHCQKTVGGKSAYIKGTPEDVEILQYLGISHVSLANNHMYDYREQGLLDTIKCLEEHGIEWYGVNSRRAQLGNDAVLMGYCCYSTNAVGLEGQRNSINLLDPIKMEYDIAEAEDDCLLPILSCHWGQEHVHFPNYDHIEIARTLSNKHSIVIHGHHPHVIQGIEAVNNSIINYSFGNFCFDDVYTKKSKQPLVKLSVDNQESYVMILSVENGKLCNYDITPFSFTDGTYNVDMSIVDKIDKWSAHLSDRKSEYIQRRAALLSDFYAERKSTRDLNWYIKRLNLESVRMLLRTKKNSKRYNQIYGKKQVYMRKNDETTL